MGAQDHDMVYEMSDLDNQIYLVRNVKDKKNAANLLSSIKEDIFKISDFLSEKIKSNNIDDIQKYRPYEEYIRQLERNLQNVEIRESSNSTMYTSYTINKGESVVFCIRSRLIAKYLDGNNIHDKNLIMYVALHEISHIACPEVGHTELFYKIFKFITETAIGMGIYEKIHFDRDPVEYCGMMITDSIL